ncbi:MAG: fimbrial protein [Bacteroidales bacterium]|uniref:fimbrial tip adhesin FimD n=1 Tax=Porphyromonas sp. TaxID=1924944 RepID=UPI002976EFA4|nr:fimbrial protein [Porphyromonas sp.]MDD7438086.1 fimbrial protein [Bacteroidales bacterium]MDY3067402.1 fimbrial protein [Porphyromonas sp.]
MNRYTLQYFIAIIFVILLIGSACTKEGSNIVPDLPDGVKAIELRVRAQNQATGSSFRSATGETTPSTRAYGSEPGDQYEGTYATDLRENIIENVEVFLFNTDGTLKKRFSGSQLRKEGNENSATLRMLIPNDEVSQYEGQSFRVVVVANATIIIPTTVVRLTELQALIQQTAGINGVPGTPQTKFLMDGAINTQTIQWGANFTYTVPGELPLRRALAKIRLRIKEVDVNVTANAQTVHYEMVGQPKVKLVHYTEKTSLIQGAPYQTQSLEWKTSNYRTMGWYTFPGKINDADPANPNRFLSANLPFYTYENDWTDDNAHETYLIVEITFRAKDPVTGVYGENKPYYYRVPINYRLPLPGMNDQEKAGLYKVQRNHLYDIVSSIGVLGSEDEGEPFEVEAYVAIQPWNEPDIMDGSIRNAHFLVVKELQPLMPNMDTRQVGYLSDLPIQPKAGTTEIEITKTVFEYYDQKGEHMVFTDNGTNVVVTQNGVNVGTYQYGQTYPGFTEPFTKFGGAKVTFDETNPQNKKLTITHAIPTNYVPYEIYFRVQHVPVAGESGTPLYKDVHVTQYPPKYVTGTKSPGYKPNEGDTGPYADFRFHDRLGAWSGTTGTSYFGTQKNDVFYKVTTVVNAGNEKIGDPTDTNGRTRTDPEANQLISPEFIIASQHGLANTNTPQYDYVWNFNPEWQSQVRYGAYYGPYSTHFEDRSPYYDPRESDYEFDDNRQVGYKTYRNADDRCYNYFEGEYGMDGNYEEYYVDAWNRRTSRTIAKTFKYKGRWRIPTVAELAYIDKIQDQAGSAVKSLLFGQYYWTAQTGMAYNFTSNSLSSQSGASVRCIFDTYKVND